MILSAHAREALSLVADEPAEESLHDADGYPRDGGEGRGLGRSALFAQLLQALIELWTAGFQERLILESLRNHLAGCGGVTAPRQQALPLGTR